MRRLARSLFTLCSAASLILCVAVCVLWVAPSRVGRGVAFNAYPIGQSGGAPPGNSGEIVSAWSSLAYVRLTIDYDDPQQLPGETQWSALRLERGRPRSFVGFLEPGARDFAFDMSAASPPGTSSLRTTVVLVPHWAVATVAAVLPAAWVARRYRRRTARRRGRCITCGYDLRATPDGCPECGTPAASSAPIPRADPSAPR